MKKFWLCLLALLVVSFVALPMVALGDTVGVTLSGVGGESDGPYFISPYILTTSLGQTFNAFCIDYDHTSFIGNSWKAYVTDPSSSLSSTYQQNGISPSAVYAGMVYLAEKYSAPGNTLADRIDIQHAIWDLSVSSFVPSPSSLPFQSPTVLGLLNLAEGVGASTDTTGWYILTDVNGTPYSQNKYVGLCGEQEFLVQGPVSTPEPGTMMLLGSGLVGLAGFARRKFKK